MIICSNCGRENEDHYKFCLGCGSQLPKAAPVVQTEPEPPKMIDCPRCTTPVPSNFKFCGACGGPIASLSAQSSPEPPRETFQREPQMSEPSLGGLGSSPSVGNALAKLVVIRPDGSEGATIPLQEGKLIIGRSSDYSVLANDMFLSPQHASITIQNGQFIIRDLDSLNGVFYRIQGEVDLVHNDMIRLGQELMKFELVSNIESSREHLPSDETLLGGSPDIGFWGKLSLIGGPDTVTRAFLLKDDEITIGREIGDIVFRDDGFVSGRHARLSKNGGNVVFKDLNSSNGTYIRIKQERTLSDGDLILMGQQLFRLVA